MFIFIVPSCLFILTLTSSLAYIFNCVYAYNTTILSTMYIVASYE